MLRWVLHLIGEPQIYHVAAAVRYKVYSFGGFSMGHRDQIEVCVFDTVSLRWMTSPSGSGRGGGGERPFDDDVPLMLYGHTVVPIEDTIYMWGGRFCTGVFCNVLYAFDVDAHRWFKPEVAGAVPEGRDDHSACDLGKVMYVYGGWTQLSGYTNDMYAFDTATMAWSFIDARGTAAAAPASLCHSAAIIGTRMFVFGGQGGHDNKIRVFDTETDRWLSTTPSSSQLLPEGRGRHSSFAYGGELYVFGSKTRPDDTGRSFNSLWKFNPQTFSWTKVEPKGTGGLRPVPSMSCCMVGDRVIFSGGLYTRDLYILDLSPSMKTLCKLAVIQFGLEQRELPHDLRWELAAMTTVSSIREN